MLFSVPIFTFAVSCVTCGVITNQQSDRQTCWTLMVKLCVQCDLCVMLADNACMLSISCVMATLLFTYCPFAAAEADTAPSTSAPADALDNIDGDTEAAPARKSRKAAVFDSDEEAEDTEAAGDPDAVQPEPASGSGDVNMAEVFGSDDDDE